MAHYGKAFPQGKLGAKQPSEKYNINTWQNRKEIYSNSSIVASKLIDNKHLSYDHVEISEASTKLVSKKKRARKTKMQVKKKTIQRNTVLTGNKDKYNVKENNVHKENLYTAKKNKKTIHSNSNTNVSHLNSKFENHLNDDAEASKEGSNGKQGITNSIDNFKIKPCFVELDKTNVLEWKNKLDNIEKLTKATQESISEKHNSLNCNKITKRSINNFKCNNVIVKDCFVRLEKLETLFMKRLHASNKCGNLISSTPIGSRIRPSHIIALSPIPITCLEELDDSVKCKENDLIRATNINLITSGIIEVNADACEDFHALKKHISNGERKSSITSICISNSDQSHITQEISKEYFEVVKDVSGIEIEEEDIEDVPSSLTKEHTPSSILQKKHLNFSIDLDRSHSLFGDTNENNVIDFKSNNTSVILDTTNLLSKDDRLNGNNTIVISDNSCNGIVPCIVLTQLQDPFRITRKRKQYCKWEFDLSNISESCNNSIKRKEISIITENDTKRKRFSRKTLRALENVPKTPISDVSMKIEKPIYLKPGKSWARSLSILSNIQNEFNLDKLSIGKGKQWRHSVVDILNMQKQGIFQSCVKKTASNADVQASSETVINSEHELTNTKGRTGESASLGRFTRRISVRVVPINKTVKSIEDTQFLEVYGIFPIKSQRFTLISDPRKSSVCNITNYDNDGHIINEHVDLTAKEVILARCLQQDYIPFSTYFSDSYLDHCRKIGEGVYGEVFLYEHDDKKSVIKIIPIEGDECVNGEPQKKFHEILSEIVIAKELHNLRYNTKYNTDGFVEVKNIKCLKGKYPKTLVDLWNTYDEEKHSENDCPSMFNENQLYIILELGHSGQDLEAFVFPTAEEAHVLFIQAALALAIAEEAVQFEHRDLHWGNILISPTTESHVYYKLGQKQIQLLSKGVKVSIIDFTLSRVTYQGCSVFNDLASDPSLFGAQGEYQFEIYRLMRDKIK
ncbi:Putative serine/threonine-protein kinase haspin like protein [Dufourea novaeangliae]|uniref:Putative serine/threonine-protein kinase haspin like protein n=1 Tax=Dufourea novaeangliae TaxID=178035 RepID=A0A154NWD1_DUFNO|nr:Putative serine/threonine-protein kinase haspin like protein [Dufourea novaeangliae]